MLSKWRHTLAATTFEKVFKSATNNQKEQSNAIDLENINSLADASEITFTSEDPADTTYAGNEVPGTLSFKTGGNTTSIQGIVSRQSKSGSTTDAFYFFDNGNCITENPQETGFAYLLTTTRSTQTYNQGQS